MRHRRNAGTPIRSLPWSVALLLCLAASRADAFELRGRLVDGTAMIREGMSQIGREGFNADAKRVPIASSPFTLTYTPSEGPPMTWSGATDGDGRFTLALDGLPEGTKLVAAVTGGERSAHYSVPVATKGGENVEFRLYQATTDPGFLRLGKLAVYHTLEGEPGEKELKLRIQVSVANMSGELFVGKKLDDESLRSSRACFRIPLPGLPGSADRPGDFTIIKNTTIGGVAPFTITESGWAILDSPIPPFPEAPRGSEYDLHYVTRGSQDMIFAYPLDIPVEQVAFFATDKEIDLATGPDRAQLSNLKATAMPFPDPDTEERAEWAILHGTDFKPGDALPVILAIDSIQLGQVNRRSLKVVCGFVVAGLIALLIGLMLGRGGPRIESVLSEASGEEIIERIAQLDAQYEKGRIEAADYEATRQRLLSLARYEVPELAAAASARAATEASGAAPAAPAVDPEIASLSARIAELEETAGSDPQKIQERLLLLEELAKAVRRSSAASDAIPAEGAATGAGNEGGAS